MYIKFGHVVWTRSKKSPVDTSGPGRLRRRSGPRVLRWCRAVGMTCLLLLFSIGSAAQCEELACSCLSPLALDEALVASDAVFIGTVEGLAEVLEPLALSQDAREPTVGAPRRIVRLEVLGVWKGPRSEKAEIRTGLSTADCGFPFEVGETYLVFANDDEGRLSTGSCSRTAAIEAAIEDLLALGPPPINPSS